MDFTGDFCFRGCNTWFNSGYMSCVSTLVATDEFHTFSTLRQTRILKCCLPFCCRAEKRAQSMLCIVQVEEHRDGCTGTTKSKRTWPSQLFFNVCPGGRPQIVVRDPLRLAKMRSGHRCSAKQVRVTWTEDTTMNEDKQCLQRGVTEVDVSKRRAGRTRLMFV